MGLNVDKLVQDFQDCIGFPYVSPGTNDERGIDCSGMFVRAFRLQGANIAHGSNSIWRKHLTTKGKITSEADLDVGMAVFKWNPNTPSKWNDDEGDFQHIGLVTHRNPIRIVHASTDGMKVKADSKVGKWAYFGRLKGVDYEQAERTVQGLKAVVTAVKGSTVNLRDAPSGGLVCRIPVGASVEILEQKTGWSKIRYGDEIGWMMNSFLDAAEQTTNDADIAAKVAELWQWYETNIKNGGKG